MRDVISASRFAVVLVCFIAALSHLGCASAGSSHVQAFLQADAIELDDDGTTHYPRWTCTITNSDGVAVAVRSEPETRRVRLKFEDESSWREFYSRMVASGLASENFDNPLQLNLVNDLESLLEYHPHRLKLGSDRRYLYLEVIGKFWAGVGHGSRGEKLLYVYDLDKRAYWGGRTIEVGGPEAALQFDEDRRRERSRWIERTRTRRGLDHQ